MFKLQDIKPILAPQYEELTSDKMYSKVKGYINNSSDYIPDYDESYITPRKCFLDIFSTLNQELTEMFINHSIKERKKTECNSREQNRKIRRDNESNQ